MEDTPAPGHSHGRQGVEAAGGGVSRNAGALPGTLWRGGSLQVSSARVFDQELRDHAREVHTAARASVWASSLDKAKALNKRLEDGRQRFNDLVAKVLPELY